MFDFVIFKIFEAHKLIFLIAWWPGTEFCPDTCTYPHNEGPEAVLGIITPFEAFPGANGELDAHFEVCLTL